MFRVGKGVCDFVLLFNIKGVITMGILYMIVFMIIIFSLINLMFDKRKNRDIKLDLIGLSVGIISTITIIILGAY